MPGVLFADSETVTSSAPERNATVKPQAPPASPGNRRARSSSWPWGLSFLAASTGITESTAGLHIVSARSFVGADGHLFTTSDCQGRRPPAQRHRARRRASATAGRWVESSRVGWSRRTSRPRRPLERARRGASCAASALGRPCTATRPTGAASALGPPASTPIYGYGWCSGNLDAPYRINPSGAPYGARQRDPRRVQRVDQAHAARGCRSSTRARRRCAKPIRDGVNAVFFTPSPRRSSAARGCTARGSRVTGFDMQLNTRYPLTIGGSGYDLQSLVAHEAGHAAGLRPHLDPRQPDVRRRPAARGPSRGPSGRQDRPGSPHLYPYGHQGGRLVSVSAPTYEPPGGAPGTVTAMFENLGPHPVGRAVRRRSACGRRPAQPHRARSRLLLARRGLPGPELLHATSARASGCTVSWKHARPRRPPKTYTETFTPVVGDLLHTRWLTGSTVNLTVTVAASTWGGGSGSGRHDPDGGSGSGSRLGRRRSASSVICWNEHRLIPTRSVYFGRAPPGARPKSCLRPPAPPPDRPWIFRTYAGYGTPRATNERFLTEPRQGPDRACRSPSTSRPRPATTRDHPMARGEVGKVGVPIGHLGDMRRVFEGIPRRADEHLDDDQRDRGLAARALRRRRRRAGRRPRGAAGHHPERRPEGVPVARHLRVPARRSPCA